VIKRKKFANKSIKMKVTAEMACSKFLKEIGLMISRAPFIMESFMKEQTDGGHVLNMTVRYSPESSQQRGGKKARERRSKRRELERTGQTGSSQETSLENGGIQEVRNGSGTDENWFIQDINQSDDSDIRNRHAGQHLLPERHHLDGRPVTSQNRDQNRLVKVKSDTENYGHLFGLLKTRIFNLEEKLTNLESDRQKDQEQMSRSQQKERIKSRQTDKQTKVFKRTFCHYCQKYCSSLHYCETKKKFRHEDSFMFMILEGEDEENLTVVGRWNNKLNMREAQILNAEKWFKAIHDEELDLAEERQHMLSKTIPRPLDESPIITEETKGELVLKWKNSKALGPNLPNHYLVEVAQHPGENWNDLDVIKKAHHSPSGYPFHQIELKDFSWEPYVEYKFRVSVFNRFGKSPASECLITTGQHGKEKIRQKPENKRTDIMTYNDRMTREQAFGK